MTLALGMAILLGAELATPALAAPITGAYRTVAGTTATFHYQSGTVQAITVPADITTTFSGDNSTTTITAIIHKPIVGAFADGTPVYPGGIASMFPLTVQGTSNDGMVFRGELLAGSQYLFDWRFTVVGSELVLNGEVGWVGGRIETTSIADARLVPIPEPAGATLLLASATAAFTRQRRRSRSQSIGR